MVLVHFSFYNPDLFFIPSSQLVIVTSGRFLLLADNVLLMKDTRNPAENPKTDVDEHVRTTTGLEHDCDGWKKDGEEI